MKSNGLPIPFHAPRTLRQEDNFWRWQTRATVGAPDANRRIAQLARHAGEACFGGSISLPCLPL
jgi:hypothetical protein